MAEKLNTSNRIHGALLEERCVLNKVLTLTGRRWLAEILLLIENDINRFSQLKTNLTGISDNILSRNLNSLLSAGAITKTIYQQVPLKVEYRLSGSGKKLVALLHGLCDWGKVYVEK